MCRRGNILINIFSLSAALSPARLGPCYRSGNNVAQQHIICAFKWECLRVMATICICCQKWKGWCWGRGAARCERGVWGGSVLSDLSHVVTNHCERCLRLGLMHFYSLAPVCRCRASVIAQLSLWVLFFFFPQLRKKRRKKNFTCCKLWVKGEQLRKKIPETNCKKFNADRSCITPHPPLFSSF